MIISERYTPWESAAYPAAEAGRLIGLNSTRVRRWLRGYDYQYADRTRHQKPVVRRGKTAGTTYASFLDLIDLLFVKQFVEHGIPLQRLRKALQEASRILNTDHFARKTFFTDGRNIFLLVKDEADALVQLLSGGQWVIAPIILELAEQIDFESPTGLAQRWYPRGPKGGVVLDPLVAFGRPTVVGRGVATASVADFYRAESRSAGLTADWLGISESEVLAAVDFEERIGQ